MLDIAGIGPSTRLQVEPCLPYVLPSFPRELALDPFGNPSLRTAHVRDAQNDDDAPINWLPWSGVLYQFIRLHHAGSDHGRILRFSQKYGVLGFCHHPATSNGLAGRRAGDCDLCKKAIVEHLFAILESRGEAGLRLHTVTRTECDECIALGPYEPVEAWVATARQARAVLNIASALRSKRQPGMDDWEALFLGRGDRNLSDWLDSGNRYVSTAYGRAVPWALISQLVTEWMRAGDVAIAADTDRHWCTMPNDAEDDAVHIAVHCETLLGHLALQLAASLSPQGLLILCDSCREPIADRKRRSRAGARSLCSECRLEADAARQRQRYARAHSEPLRGSQYRGVDYAESAVQPGERVPEQSVR